MSNSHVAFLSITSLTTLISLFYRSEFCDKVRVKLATFLTTSISDFLPPILLFYVQAAVCYAEPNLGGKSCEILIHDIITLTGIFWIIALAK